MTVSKRQWVLMAAVVGVAFASAAQAAEYTWTPTAAGTYDWNAATSNWTSGFPSLAGDVANVNNNLAGSQTIRLQQGISVGVLNLGDSDGSHAFTISSGTGTNTLTFDSGDAGTAAQLNVANAGILTNTIQAPVALASDLNLNLAPSTVATALSGVSFSGNLTLNGKVLSINGGMKLTPATAADRTQMAIAGGDTLIGNGTIINNSDSPMVITGDKASFTGTLIANGQGVGQDQNTGSITLSGASVRNAAEIIVNGWHDGSTHLGGKLQIGTGSPSAPPANQRLTQNRITMNGGLFNDAGVALSGTNYTTLQTDTVANLHFKSGFALANVSASDTSAGNQLNVTTMERSQGATAFYRAAGTATSLKDTTRPAGYTYISQMKAANGASLVVGSTATSGAGTRIIPWMIASTNTSNVGFGGFATYDDAVGIRVYTAAERSTSFADGANVYQGNVSNLAQDWNINSLYHNSGGIQNPNVDGGPERTITIASGGLAFSLNGGGIGVAGNSNGRAGKINFGSAEGIIFSPSAATNYIGSAIVGAGGLTKGGFGRLVLTGANDIEGDTYVGGGVLQVGDGTYLSSIGSGDVFVDGGAMLDIRGLGATEPIDVIGDGSMLSLNTAGLFTGQLYLVGMETVGDLRIGGTLIAPGDYTSASAGMGNYITGTGTLHVVGVSVPEPVSMSIIGLGVAALLRRQRRA